MDITFAVLALLLSTHVIEGTKTFVCEDGSLELSCDQGEVLVIETANYGRTEEDRCGKHKLQRPCKLHSSLPILSKECFGRSSCKVAVNDKTFANPCPKVPKYLEVDYRCIKSDLIYNICDTPKITTAAGYIISPNYPASYDKDKKCELWVVPQKDKQTDTSILDIEVEARDSMGCFDMLTLKEQKRPWLRHDYCGNIMTITQPAQLSFEAVSIQFKADSMNQYRGFLLKFNSSKIPPKEEPTPQPVAPGPAQEKPKVDNVIKVQVPPEAAAPVAPVALVAPAAPVAPAGDNSVIVKEAAAVSVGKCTEESAKSLLPVYGVLSKLVAGKVALVSCQEGYALKDPDEGVLVCYQDSWVGFPGVCVVSGCGPLDDIEHGTVTVMSSAEGSQAEYRCDPGYQLTGEMYRACLWTKKWSGLPPLCLANNKTGRRRGRSPYNLGVELPLAVACTLVYLMIKKRLTPEVNSKLFHTSKTV